MIVAIEGIDASGKQTLTKNLVNRYTAQGDMPATMSFPAYHTHTGKLIKAHLSGDLDGKMVFATPEARALTLQALMAVNRYEFINTLHTAKKSTEKLILDRYWYSGLVYGSEDGLDVDWLVQIHKVLPRADCTLYIDISVEESVRRRPRREDRYERDLSFLKRVRETYLDMQSLADQPFHVINGAQSEEAVVRDAVKAISMC